MAFPIPVPCGRRRAFAEPYGASTFLVLAEPPTATAWTVVIDAPGLTAVLAPSGAVELHDASGAAVGELSRPYAMDSTPDEYPGGGRASTAVRYALGGQAGDRLEWGQASCGNTTTSTYDPLGRLLTRTTTPGPRASYTSTYNRAGNRLTEASTITGDPANGTATTGYDPLDRLTAYALPGIRTLADTWQAVPNRDTQTFDAANRPTGAYAYDADGRMTGRPGSSGGYLEWDSLGRLVRVRVTGGGAIVAAYAYDALDRLLTVDRPGQTRIRFRYAGTSTAVVGVADDATGAVLRNVTVGPEGTLLEDWLGASRRLYGVNGHHDTTWTADDTGAVTREQPTECV